MKRFLPLCLTVMLVFSLLTGCDGNGGQADPTPPAVSDGMESPVPTVTPPIEPETSVEATPEATPVPEEGGEPEPALEDEVSPQELEARHQAMLPLLSALARCQSENGMDYDPRKQDFFWVALCYAIGQDGANHPLVTVEEWSVQTPRQVVQEYASALFADYDDLLEIPSILGNSVWYDEDWDAYGFTAVDPLGETAAIESWEQRPDGTYEAELSWTVDGEESRFRVTLIDNPYVDGITQPTFYYTVSGFETM